MKTTDTQKNAGMVARFDNREAKGDCSPATCSLIGSSTRRHDAWYPVLEASNGGRVIGAIQCWTEEEARLEAWEMVRHIEDYPESYRSWIPAPNQLIDLTANAQAD